MTPGGRPLPRMNETGEGEHGEPPEVLAMFRIEDV
jgi:hypothetical protein